MLRDRKALIEREFVNLKAEAARLYLEAVTSGRTAISPEYEAVRNKLHDCIIDLDVVNGLIAQGHK
jgi:hypothetical protein